MRRAVAAMVRSPHGAVSVAGLGFLAFFWTAQSLGLIAAPQDFERQHAEVIMVAAGSTGSPTSASIPNSSPPPQSASVPASSPPPKSASVPASSPPPQSASIPNSSPPPQSASIPASSPPPQSASIPNSSPPPQSASIPVSSPQASPQSSPAASPESSPAASPESSPAASTQASIVGSPQSQSSLGASPRSRSAGPPSPGPGPSPGPSPGPAAGAGGGFGAFGVMFEGGDLGLTGGGGVEPGGEDCEFNDDLTRTCIPLIAPLGKKSSIEISPDIGTFLDYFADISGWLFEVAVGFCVLWILIGGYFIMISGSDGGKRGTGKSMITWAIIGLLIINFAGFVLRLLNDIFFV